MGHRPFANVEPRPIGPEGAHPAWASAPPPKHGSRHFEQTPLRKGDTYVTPGYSGWVRGAQDTFGQSPCLLPTPDRVWYDTRSTATQYNPQRSYRAEVGGVVPGYKGHMPESLRNAGSSNFGGVETRDMPGDHDRFAQSRHSASGPPANRSLPRPGSNFEARCFGAVEQRRPHSARGAIESAALGIVARSGGVVPQSAALAAAKSAARGAARRAASASKAAADARLALIRSKTQSGFVNDGVVPGYRGHVPRYREDVGTSPYKGRGADSKVAMNNTRLFGAGFIDQRPDDARSNNQNKGSSFGVPQRDIIQVL